MLTIRTFYITLTLTIRDRLRTLAKEPELGAGGVSLEHVLLAIGGIVAAGIVVAAIAAVITSKTADLNP